MLRIRSCLTRLQLNSGVSWRLIVGADRRTFEQLVNTQPLEMSTASSRALMRLLTAAFLLLLRSDTLGRASISVHRHHSSRPAIAAANHSALPAATPEPKHVDTARPQLLASEASLLDGRAQSPPAPTRVSLSFCSYEHTTGQAARPPPFQA